MSARPRRSVLYMPGSNARALEKARSIPADALILDLEDSVAPVAKADARRQVCEALHARAAYGRRELVVRVNGIATPWFADDMAAVVAAAPDGLLIPKVNGPGDLEVVADRLESLRAPPGTRVWAMMETPLAVLAAGAIAAARTAPRHRLDVLVVGANDLCKETRAELQPGRTALLPWLMIFLAAARAYGLDILDSAYNDFRDGDGFRAECGQARSLGFDGKTLIHPDQVAVANEVLAPTAAEIAWAQRVVAAFDAPEHRDQGVISIDGRMVERLHAEMARRTIAIAEAIARLG